MNSLQKYGIIYFYSYLNFNLINYFVTERTYKLISSITQNDIDEVKQILESNVDVNFKDKMGLRRKIFLFNVLN